MRSRISSLIWALSSSLITLRMSSRFISVTGVATDGFLFGGILMNLVWRIAELALSHGVNPAMNENRGNQLIWLLFTHFTQANRGSCLHEILEWTRYRKKWHEVNIAASNTHLNIPSCSLGHHTPCDTSLGHSKPHHRHKWRYYGSPKSPV